MSKSTWPHVAIKLAVHVVVATVFGVTEVLVAKAIDNLKPPAQHQREQFNSKVFESSVNTSSPS